MPIYVSGAHTATLDGYALGKTEDGFSIEITQKGKPVTFDELGDSMVDLVTRGAEVTIEAVLKEWYAPGMQRAIWPYTTPTLSNFGAQPCAGLLAVGQGYAKPLILTGIGCTPAGSSDYTTSSTLLARSWTFHNVVLMPDFAARINLNNDLRVVPVKFTAFLTEVSTVNRFFTIA